MQAAFYECGQSAKYPFNPIRIAIFEKNSENEFIPLEMVASKTIGAILKSFPMNGHVSRF
jgi:hypothetical protein